MRALRFAAIAVTVAFWLSACGASKSVGGYRIAGDTLTIYSSLPFHGASAASGRAVLQGERLALAQIHNRIGDYAVVLRSLDDSTAQRGTWDPGQTNANARAAVTDKTTVGYVGDLDSGASAVAVPVLNRVQIPQVSPMSSAVGLTASVPGASPGEPQKYYPTGIRTLVRVTPTDAVQARVQVRLQRAAGCRRTFVVDDGEVDGEAMATSFQLTARSAGLDVIGVQSFQPDATDYIAFASGISQTRADCILVSAITDSGAAAVTRQLALAMPHVRLFGTSGLVENTFADQAEGGIPPELDPRIVLTGQPPGTDPAARSFYAAYARHYGDPSPGAIYGYEAMSLLLSAISQASHDGRRAVRRAEVLDTIFHTRDRRSVLGTYSIEPSGDTTIRRFGVYRLNAGRLEFWRDLNG